MTKLSVKSSTELIASNKTKRKVNKGNVFEEEINDNDTLEDYKGKERKAFSKVESTFVPKNQQRKPKKNLPKEVQENIQCEELEEDRNGKKDDEENLSNSQSKKKKRKNKKKLSLEEKEEEEEEEEERSGDKNTISTKMKEGSENLLLIGKNSFDNLQIEEQEKEKEAILFEKSDFGKEESEKIIKTTDSMASMELDTSDQKEPAKKVKKKSKEERKRESLLQKKQEIERLENEVNLGSESMSNDIKIERFDISYPGKVLFKDATLNLSQGRRYGLVGPNGLGKSTLLKEIASRRGEFREIPRHFEIHYVEQEVYGDDKTALESVLEADMERTRLMEEEAQLLAALEKESESEPEKPDDSLGTRLAEVHVRLEEIEAYAAEARAASILRGLQFSEEMLSRATRTFSGGWRMRIALARALFRRPTLLLLDEPTNHLDLLAVIWLETHLQLHWKHTLLVVSHDQDFLDNICTDVIHVYQQKLSYYKGNYSHFKHAFAESVALKRKAFDKQQELIKQIQRQKTKKQDKTKSSDKAKHDIRVMKNPQMKKLAEKKKGNIEQDASGAETTLLTMVPHDYAVQFSFPDPSPLSIPIIQVSDASFGYVSEKPLFEHVRKKLSEKNCNGDQCDLFLSFLFSISLVGVLVLWCRV